MLANLSFLALDITIAHAVNAFAEPAEWVPLAYSVAGPALLAAAIGLGGLAPRTRPESARGRLARAVGLAVGWAGVLIGVVGLLLHLESQFFHEQTLKNLVYTAPFVAPLAYAGVGFLVLLNRMVDARTEEWARWVVLLTLGGFVGNLALCLADHAQNGFFHPAEWIGVVASAYAVSTLLAVLIFPSDRRLRAACGWVLGVQAVVGVLGFAYHARADLYGPMETAWENILYGAPIFAPLLFANLALLGGIGLWGLAAASPATAPD